jgi:hypothetical protein
MKAQANSKTNEAVKKLKEKFEKELHEKIKCPRKWEGYRYWLKSPVLRQLAEQPTGPL